MELLKGKMSKTPSFESISTKQQRIAALARQAPQMAFTNLAHHIDLEWLYEAHRRTRKDGATGVDGQTWHEYDKELAKNNQGLLNRAKAGTYRAPPVRRVHIPKSDGTTRPLGIPTLEDKVLQRAVVMLLEAIYEQDFMDCSYGFRPGRSAHQALNSFRNQMMEMGGGWVVEVDIKKFFDTIDHGQLMEIVRQRVNDGVVLRLIGKWLNAGVMEEGKVTHPEAGTPQGGVISPMLANIFLHEVLDKWFEKEVKPRLEGKAFLVRYADDFVIGLASERDAQRVMEVLPKRFGKHGLTVHPGKTKVVAFRPPRKNDRDKGGPPEPGTFDLLGFTIHWAKSLKGNWVIRMRTARSRFKRGVMAIAEWCRRAMHWPLREQHKKLSQKLKGHNAYYGLTGNARNLERFRYAVRREWRAALARRSQKGMTWEAFAKVEKVFKLPPAIAIHSVLRRTAKP